MLQDPTLSFLLHPISPQAPAGVSIRHTPFYDGIQALRVGDEILSDVPEDVWKTDFKKPDWKKVLELCQQALQTQSKDLQLVVWMSEALLFLEGLKGFQKGLTVLHALSTTFWESLYPQFQQGDFEERLAPYEWMEYHLPDALASLTIAHPLHKNLPCYTLADWMESLHWDLVSRQQSNPEAFLAQTGKPLLSEVLNSVKQTPLSFYEALEADARAIIMSLENLEEAVSARVQQEVSLFFRLKEQLKKMLGYLEAWKEQARLSSQPVGALFQEAAEGLEGKKAPAWEKAAQVSTLSPPKHLSARKEAYEALAQITDFLMKTDPHSPTPYLLRRTLDWQDKSLPEVYADFTQDSQELLFLMRLLGVSR